MAICLLLRIDLLIKHPQQESNLQLALRRGLLYPFNYEGKYIPNYIHKTVLSQVVEKNALKVHERTLVHEVL